MFLNGDRKLFQHIKMIWKYLYDPIWGKIDQVSHNFGRTVPYFTSDKKGGFGL